MWHSLHAISTQISPVPGCQGIEVLQAETFDLHCFQTPTGTKFLVLVEPSTANVAKLLQTVYELYSDFVLKNPFYEVEMPIRCELFDSNLSNLVASFSG
uniref:Trafficking protein particle complex subunit n=1 Tax=Tetraselmis sp. GSL018 TaxID=582737 RepID=A0A061R8G5_9CHLO|mmetsp:Transcript_41997/g.99557  ORF Transcript_41997/g.99557 Transcript_41997/m.99557 type:complete len:99 (+) Transcript_41997:458-754(+)|eukprot:CAMPEP_0177592944 /NCGR_PEP_ID=MMETSP0419_2-20121207/8843_1 /TAXON_ID=582737 /ORGANISM="Tetraselmis sp., Strain GSL018" /LENGTH=98 /DNA_ID=CAMNT_0019083871 /DNA_START=278 /DNA_END=574 /DNA_ORIENTATION=+